MRTTRCLEEIETVVEEWKVLPEARKGGNAFLSLDGVLARSHRDRPSPVWRFMNAAWHGLGVTVEIAFQGIASKISYVEREGITPLAGPAQLGWARCHRCVYISISLYTA
jgi:hypothetical protein